jgi:hypothetical protein
MNAETRPLMAWARDLALAYAGGLVLGAPVAVTAAWLTGVERVATACLLLAMALLFVALRRRPVPAQTCPGDASSAARGASVPSRRVA